MITAAAGIWFQHGGLPGAVPPKVSVIMKK